MALIKTPEEIHYMREGGHILAGILHELADASKPGISTFSLDKLARDLIKSFNVKPAFEGYQMGSDGPKYPAVLCVSVDNEVVHGIPSKDKILEEGQIVGLDLGIIHKNLYTDSAITVPIGKINSEDQSLLITTSNALQAGIEQVRPGNHIGDISAAIESYARRGGFAVIRDLIGHGVGYELHEKPDIPNYGKRGSMQQLKTGMVFAIEPMFTQGGWRVNILDDGWTVVTSDGSKAAHFEHTVAVTENGYEILTKH